MPRPKGKGYDNSDLEKFLALYPRCECNKRKAAGKAGLTVYLVNQALEAMPWFKEEYDKLTEEFLSGSFDDIEENMLKKAKRNAIIGQFMLTHHPEGKRRGYSKRSEVTGKDGGPINWVQLMKEAGEGI